jgi:hypothetical protein
VKDHFKYMFMHDQKKSSFSLLIHDMAWIPSQDCFSMDIKNVIFVNCYVDLHSAGVFVSQGLRLGPPKNTRC